MKDVDEVLRDAGSRWRAAQPDPREVDAALFTSTARTWGGWATRLAVASVAGVVVLAFGIVQWRAGVGIGAPPSASARPSAAMTTPSRGPVLAAGDRVRATGVVVARANGAVSFCLPAVVDLSGEAGVVCSPVSVGIEGLDLSALPGWSPDAEGGSSGRVTVTGTWTGTGIQADPGAVAAAALSRPLPVAACPPPATAWPTSELVVETELTRLGSEIESEPDRFSGYWVASRDGDNVGSVAVVGTRDDPELDRARLAGIVDLPLCVVQVEFSASDLAAAQRAARSSDPAWQVQIFVELDRVVVELPFVDASALAFVESHPEVILRPMVARD